MIRVDGVDFTRKTARDQVVHYRSANASFSLAGPHNGNRFRPKDLVHIINTHGSAS